jgi:AcrR family transcriptional regulator
MRKKAKFKRARSKQKRLSPDDRRKEFVAKATEFFSEQGFGGGTRDLARRLGVTQPLLYRYFPSKDDLIKEVYRTVYLEPLDTGWEKLFTDQKCTLCHSVGGKGNVKGPLDEIGSKLQADDIRAWLTDAKAMTAKTKAARKPEMKAYTLPKEDVDALVAYLSAMKKK